MSSGPLAIFVTYNSAGFIGSAVQSCLNQHLKVLVVDNASSDRTVPEVPVDPAVEILVNQTNRGFAAAVNQAVRARPAEQYLLLNPDLELLDEVDPLRTAVTEKGHSAAAGLLVDHAGKQQKGFTFRRLPTLWSLAFEVLGLNRIWPGNPVNRRYRCLDANLLQPQKVEQPAGAFLLFRRVDWERLGGFDEGFYPVWFEDVDFCQRLLSAGGTIWFDPSVRARHYGGHSVQRIDLGCRQRFWYGSLLRYAGKHFSPSSRRILAVLVQLAIVPRVLFSKAGGASKYKSESIRNIWSLAWKCFRTGISTE